MNYDEDDISKKSPLVTLFLLLFFGSLGAHRFYVNKYFTAILYLLLGTVSNIISFLGFGFSIWFRLLFFVLIIIDFYALYSDSFTDSKGKLVIGKNILIYETFEERDKNIFIAKLNKLMLALCAIALYIIYFILARLL